MELNDEALTVLRKKIKAYESQFKTTHNRKPAKDDIDSDEKMRKYYKLYWKYCNTQDKASKVAPKVIQSKVINNAWSRNLNKQPPTKQAGTGDKELDRFFTLGGKLQQMNEQHHFEEGKTDKQLKYSMAFKRRQQLEKSKQISSELLVKKQAEANKRRNQEEHISLTYDNDEVSAPEPMVQSVDIRAMNEPIPSEPRAPVPSEPRPPILTEIDAPTKSAFSLLESLANGGSDLLNNREDEHTTTFDVDQADYTLDNVNDFIKNAILNNGLLDSKPRPKPAKRSIYDLEDDDMFSFTNKAQPATNFVHNDIPEHSFTTSIEHVSSDSNDSDYMPTKKFFRSRTVKDRTEYGPSNFFDHIKDNEFNFPVDKPADKTPKLTNITNKDLSSVDKADKPGKKKPASKKAEKGNFRRLQMKKKTFVRGHKKFNMKAYKFKSWKKNKSGRKFDNKCFKCGSPDHFANSCPSNESASAPLHTEGDFTTGEEVQTPINFDQVYDICLTEPLFSDINDAELEQLVDESLTTFGFENFRPNQKEAIKRILCGKSTLLVSPTGTGKSLCYQLAAYCFWKKKQLITIVVSPLISLMRDQMANFPPALKAVCINSSMTDKEKEAAVNAITYGQAAVLFLSPECIVGGSLYSINFSAFSRIAFVCIDEAHCLAEWSTNFRPAYLHLYKILRYRLKIQTMLAMTATVTADTTAIICKNLHLNQSEDVLGGTRVPSNLILTVSRKNNKLTALVELLKSEPFKSLKSIIIYCTKRDQTTQLETQIRTLMQFDLPKAKMNRLVRAYHAGLSTYERTSIQEQFISGKLRIIVATIAFGMGINKPDISGIIHYNMPKSFENYVQEIGRAGRDGQTAYCHLFLDNEGEDLFSLQSYIYANGIDKPNLRRLVAKIYQPCKCNLLAALDDQPPEEDAQPGPSTTCSGHPVALPIASTELEVDLKSENIYTILMALEQSWPSAPIQVLTPSNSMATVVNFGDEADMYALVKQSAILQMGATLSKQVAKDAFTFSNFSFSFVKVAAMLSMEVNAVRSELRKLEWTTDPVTKRKKRSHVAIRFGDYSYMLKAPGNLSENDIEEVVAFLADTIEQYEAKEVYKLRFLYSKFCEFVIEDINDDKRAVIANSANIKHFINEYFSSTNLCPLPADLDSSKLTLPRYFNLANQDMDAISLVIRDFLNVHHGEGVNSPRKIARVLQGISSPKYPAEIWGKVRRFWRCLPMIDFKHLLELCREGLINNYSLPSNTN